MVGLVYILCLFSFSYMLFNVNRLENNSPVNGYFYKCKFSLLYFIQILLGLFSEMIIIYQVMITVIFFIIAVIFLRKNLYNAKITSIFLISLIKVIFPFIIIVKIQIHYYADILCAISLYCYFLFNYIKKKCKTFKVPKHFK